MAVRLTARPKHKPKGLPRVPDWVVALPEFEEHFLRTWKPEALERFEKLDEFKQHLYDTYSALRTEGVLRRRALGDALSEFQAGVQLLRLVTTPHLSLTKISYHITTYPQYQPLLQGRFRPDGTVDTTALEQRLQELLDEAGVEPTVDDELRPQAPPDDGSSKGDPSPNLARILKLALPSSRACLKGLRPNGLTSPPTNKPHAKAKIAKTFWQAQWEDDCRVSEDDCDRYCASDLPTWDDGLVASRVTLATVTDSILATNNTSAGPDGIPFRAYRCLVDIAAPLVLSIIEHFADGGLPPTGFNYAFLYLLPKKQTQLIEDTRPISVTNADNRIIAKCFISAVLPLVQARLHAAQKGSIAGRQGTEHIQELTDVFYSALEHTDTHTNYHILFIDTKKAFDSIRHQFIFTALRRLGIPEWGVNIVKALLHKVAVTPFFEGYTQVWIPITKGVKQGCPTSPVIFAICLDVLVCRLAAVSGVRIWAYVDDMAIGTEQVRQLGVCMKLIDAFTRASGLGINKDKTQLLSARMNPTGHDAEVWLSSKSCPWHDKGVKATRTYTYLGILIGRGVTVADVWRPVVNKAIDRIAKYAPALRALSLVRRIVVFNIFIRSLFTYVAPFYSLPDYGDASFAQLRSHIRSAFLPFGRTGSSYAHYIAPTHMFSPPVPLHDLWAGTKTALIAQADLTVYHGVDDVTAPDAHYTSMRVTTQVHEAGKEFVNFVLHTETAKLGRNQLAVFDTTPFSSPNPLGRRKAIYASLVASHMRFDRTDLDLKRLLKKRLLKHDPTAITNLHKHFAQLPAKTPKSARYHQYLMVFNAVHTSRRTRHVRLAREGDGKVAACRLCRQHEDSVQHLCGGLCPVVVQSLKLYSTAVNLNLSPEPLGAKNEWGVAHLDFPAKHKAQALAIVVFNWAVWYMVKTIYDLTVTTPSISSAAQHIARFAASRLRTATARQGGGATSGRVTTFGSTGNRTAEQKEAARAHAMAMINAAPVGATIVFTDGSASASPPASGAGAVITTATQRIEVAVALGCGTNNTSEMWAIGAAATKLATMPPSYTLLLTDSKISKDLVNSKARPKTNVPLVRAVRESVRKLRATRTVYVCWVAGHVGIDDNEAADALAELGRQRSADGRGMPDPAIYYSYDDGININNAHTAITQEDHG